jgi:type VI secretion system protein ImpJ
MRHAQVSWHEGQFLRPQHLQAADRYWNEVNRLSGEWSLPANYGIRSLEFSREALANNQFELRSLDARMRDGTIVQLQSGQEPDRVNLAEGLSQEITPADLAEGFNKSSTVTVYVAIPRLKLGRKNVASDGTAETRFQDSLQLVADEHDGANDQEIRVRHLNVQLRLSTQDLSGYEVLPLVRLKRAGAEQASPEPDREFIPPLLAIDAVPELGKEIIRGVFDVISRKIEVLSQQVSNRGVGFESRHPGDLDRLLMLSRLNESVSVLRTLAFGNGIHPLTAYIELSRIVGGLAVFAPERIVPELPLYDHENLGQIFHLVKLEIGRLLNTVQEYEYEQRFFTGVGLGLQVSLKSEWFHSDWDWFVGVKKGDLTSDEVRQLLSAGQLDWKLGSSRQVEQLFQHRAQGLEIVPLERQIRALPSDQEWLFYDIPRQRTPAWQDVQVTETLAMRLKDSLILNFNQLQGQRSLEVSVRGKRASVEFALFAVPRQS